MTTRSYSTAAIRGIMAQGRDGVFVFTVTGTRDRHGPHPIEQWVEGKLALTAPATLGNDDPLSTIEFVYSGDEGIYARHGHDEGHRHAIDLVQAAWHDLGRGNNQDRRHLRLAAGLIELAVRPDLAERTMRDLGDTTGTVNEQLRCLAVAALAMVAGAARA